jgi:hypothetical protein
MPIDLLFTDVVMPGPLRSIELARQAKALLPGLGAVHLGLYAERDRARRPPRSGRRAAVSKPYRRDQLARKMRHLLAALGFPFWIVAKPYRLEDLAGRAGAPGLRLWPDARADGMMAA